MIFFAFTNPKKKIVAILKLLVFCLILVLLVPAVLNVIQGATQAMEMPEKESEYPGEPIRVQGNKLGEELAVWDTILTHYSF